MEIKKLIQVSETIQYLVSNNITFAMYKLPNSSSIDLVVSLGINKEEYFIIQDFDSSNKENIIEKDIFLQNEQINIPNIKKYIFGKNNYKFNTRKAIVFTKEMYKEYVSAIVEKCKNEEFSKCVPARIIVKNKDDNFCIGNYFIKLVKEYKTAFVNLYFHPNTGLWLGATPELLLKKNGNVFETFSLAGTKLISKNRNWNPKEIEEQQIVTNYILDLLIHNNCEKINTSKVKTIDAGQIQHLKTTIQFHSDKDINSIAKLLHPTPAVCGMPQKKSFDFIITTEGKQRENYAGFIGINFKKEQILFVNLRCMQILEGKFLIYVGAGVTKDSIPENEWTETENKSETLMQFMD